MENIPIQLQSYIGILITAEENYIYERYTSFLAFKWLI
jgi:hypothetical protein